MNEKTNTIVFRPSDLDPQYRNEKYIDELLFVEPFKVEENVTLGDKTFAKIVHAKITICSGPDEGRIYDDAVLSAVNLVRVAIEAVGKGGFGARLTRPGKAYVFADPTPNEERKILHVAGLGNNPPFQMSVIPKYGWDGAPFHPHLSTDPGQERFDCNLCTLFGAHEREKLQSCWEHEQCPLHELWKEQHG